MDGPIRSRAKTHLTHHDLHIRQNALGFLILLLGYEKDTSQEEFFLLRAGHDGQ